MKTDKKIALVIFVLIAGWGYLTWKLPGSTMVGEPGPKFFPTILLVLMAICTLILFLYNPKEKEPEISEEDLKKYEEIGIEIEREEVFEVREAMLLFGLFLSGILIMYFLGYIIGMTIGLTAMLCYVGWKVPKAVILSLIITSAVFLLFNFLLHVPLPAGTLL